MKPMTMERARKIRDIWRKHPQEFYPAAPEALDCVLNSHDALVAACKAALERLEASCPPNGGRTEAVCEQIRAALALERGQEQEKR